MGRRAWEGVYDSVIPRGIWRAPTSGIYTSSRTAGARFCSGSWRAQGAFAASSGGAGRAVSPKIFLSCCQLVIPLHHATPVQPDTPLA